MKASTEFVVGKHGIYWINSTLQEHFKDAEFDKKPIPTYQKLPRTMKDAEIEYELKPGFCELGDLLAFLDNAPQECKDGWANLFYFPAFVVVVYWDGGGWRVIAWCRGGDEWGADRRFFSPATGRSESSPSDTLELRISELEAWKKKVDKILKVE